MSHYVPLHTHFPVLPGPAPNFVTSPKKKREEEEEEKERRKKRRRREEKRGKRGKRRKMKKKIIPSLQYQVQVQFVMPTCSLLHGHTPSAQPLKEN